MEETIHAHQVRCPKCKQIVDRVDGEYARHYVVLSILCTGSLRKINEPAPS